MTINNFLSLAILLVGLPEGTTCDVLSQDLETGNFEVANLQLPSGEELAVEYEGEVIK
jgi:hypothetical protein